MEKVKAKKSLGQNFLRDRNVIDRIIKTFDIKPADFILEIGPGMGALTEHLIGRCRELIAVEFDSRAVEYLKEKFPASKHKNFTLHSLDFREFNFGALFNEHKEPSRGKLNVIGNIPYNISSDILFHLIENRDYINKAQLMVQKEVAQRLVSLHSNKNYGITTIAVNLVGSCDMKFEVSPNCFEPQPKVTSAIIELRFTKQISEELYRKTMMIVKAAFNQRRKQLRNSLKNYLVQNLGDKSEKFIEYMDEKKSNLLTKRPENLTYNEYIELNEEILNFDR